MKNEKLMFHFLFLQYSIPLFWTLYFLLDAFHHFIICGHIYSYIYVDTTCLKSWFVRHSPKSDPPTGVFVKQIQGVPTGSLALISENVCWGEGGGALLGSISADF